MLGIALVALVVLVPAGCRLAEARRLIEDATSPAVDLEGLVEEREESIEGLRVRRYGEGPRILVCHGAVADGIDDPRLVSFARALALRGFEVITPQLESLCRFRVDVRDPDRIARVAGRQPVTLAGISIGGSYCLIAATRPGVDVRCVLSFGGYADLESLVTRWLSPPSESAPELLDPLREGRRRVLEGNRSRLDPAAFETAMASEQPLATRDAERLIAPLRSDLRALSPVRQPAARTRVFLLHADEDPVVPASDAEQLARHYGHARLLVTDLFGHVDAKKRPGLLDAYPLLSFLADFMGAAR